ncbi:UDP-glucose 6-dehydrogenase TuaD [bacterium BMS3Abin05]|nr:UDP-glucose 6-dehydrogenase TuaD [bacterium BMS3Abin05]HDK35963.1 UDP-glucose/GDP-mannose dehydrogenase family protein [Bacteroidota bacterium]HDL78480.1 UDP-glucose/GDP-mannose dehydrogenase family protein [Bacteroidota bacterium]HDZ12924.1 UDP-glucose/GDP-mannose dehydrogenase family protein [Bacteroidota bacterium]
MHIAIIGTGYVGLVTGTCFAEFGNEVICVDMDKPKINKLNRGEIPIYEPGLDVMVAKNVKENRLHFTSDIEEAIEKALVIFIAVGTPPKPDGSADLQYIEAVAKDIAKYKNGYKVIVNKSTAPVGTGKWIKSVIEKNQKNKIPFSVASNPEFLREGSAIDDFMRPDRVVIGAETDEAIAIMKDLYAPLYLIETPFVITNIESAELIKYAANAFLATKISYINEIGSICEIVGADVHDVARGMGLDNRIGRKFLHAGPGYGGSCFPKDTSAIYHLAKQKGYDFKIVGSAIEINRRQRERMFQKIKNAMGDLKGKKIAVLGLAFKPNTDDMRDAPSVEIIKNLLRAGAKVRAFDPVAMENAKHILQNVEYANDAYDTLKDCDALIFMTEWNQFRSMDLDKIKMLMKSNFVFDLRNIYEPEKIREKGFNYYSVGRAKGKTNS